MATETLTCEVCGKDWARERRGGKKPKSCPGECREKYPSLYSKRYRERPGNREKHLEYMKEYHKTYDEENAEKIAEYKAQWYAKNRERLLEAGRERYLANREGHIAACREWAKANPDKVRENRRGWYRKNKGSEAVRNVPASEPAIIEAQCTICGKGFTYQKLGAPRGLCSEECARENVRRSSRHQYEKDPERAREQSRANKARYRDQNREYNKRHREANKHLYNAYAASRRAIRAGAFVEDVHITELLKMSGSICGICKGVIPDDADYGHALYPNIDHIVPLSKGGEHSYANTQAVHASCNMQKGDKLDGWQDIKPILNQEEQTWLDQAQEMTTQNTSATTSELSSNGASM